MLHVVATPIGNLGDISARALECLKSASLIACEDTRRTWQLLTHFGIPRPEMVSYRQGNEERIAEHVVAAVNAGREVALCSDGGYPGISDPGYRLIRKCATENVPYDVIPGASAVNVALLMSGVVSIIDAISYGLIIFVSVSLVVSSIMIGIITYISVLERTKEIGILRAIGASKKDISRVFNAETLIIGFTSGMLGIIISLILCIPISMIVHALSGITAINAFLEPSACIVLVAISMFLTFISGLIPSGIASKKDPVEALRTE